MKRRTLDVIFSVGGVLLAVLLLVLGFVLRSNENFAKDYVTKQLSAQQISFKPAATLTAEEKAQPCLVQYAGQNLVTGKQAECYANNFIAVHLAAAAKGGGYEGSTYATLGTPQGDLSAKVAAAQKANDPNLITLQKNLAAVSGLRDTMFKGETLRGLLLTSFGFSEFGRKAQQAAMVCFIGFILMLVLSAAGFVHYFAAARREAHAGDYTGSMSPSHA